MTTNEQGRALAAAWESAPDEGAETKLLNAGNAMADWIAAHCDAAERAPGVMTDGRINQIADTIVPCILKSQWNRDFARAIEQEARAPLLAQLAEKTCEAQYNFDQWQNLGAECVKSDEAYEARITELERQLAVKERETLERAVAACEKIEDEYREREGTKWPEMKQDAETGARDCAEAIRALTNGGEGGTVPTPPNPSRKTHPE